MTKRLFLLNGLAILAVVCSHATGWGSIAMSPWADRYRLVVGPDYDQTGTLPYYMLLAMKCLMPFSVPAFLFVSGFFVAYAARGSQSALSWKMVIVRLRNLLVPYLIWSVVIFWRCASGHHLHSSRIFGTARVLGSIRRVLLCTSSLPVLSDFAFGGAYGQDQGAPTALRLGPPPMGHDKREVPESFLWSKSTCSGCWLSI